MSAWRSKHTASHATAATVVEMKARMERRDLEEEINRALRQLTPREEEILRVHFGLGGDPREHRRARVPLADVLAPAMTARALRKLRLRALLDGEPEMRVVASSANSGRVYRRAL